MCCLNLTRGHDDAVPTLRDLTHFSSTINMHIRPLFFSILVLIPAFEAQANESCGLQAARLLAAGKTAELATLFAQPSELAAPLQRALENLGQLSELQEVASARFAQHQRVSIGASDLPASYHYHGYWINAVSSSAGPLQFHIASVAEASCKLLALHIDTEK
jgi:hypothetical protein